MVLFLTSWTEDIAYLEPGAKSDKLPSRKEREATALDLCRRGEIDFQNSRLDDAIARATEARQLAPDNLDVAQFAAKVFMTTGERDAAISALESIHAAGVATAGQERSLSGFLAASSEIDKSIVHAIAACELEPENHEYARHAGMMLNFSGRATEAIRYLLFACRGLPDDGLVYYVLAAASGAIGRIPEAVVFSRRAWELDSKNIAHLQYYIHWLQQDARSDEAVEVLEQAFADEQEGTPDLWCLLGTAYMNAKEFKRALEAARSGLALDPKHIGLLMMRGVTLCSMGRYDEAVDAMKLILEQDPDHDAAQRVTFAALSAAGHYEHAVPLGASLLRLNPDDEGIGRSFVHILTRRFVVGSPAAYDPGGLAALKRQKQRHMRERRKIELAEAFSIQLRVIGALILREIRGRFGRAKLGYLWAIFEPLMHISLLATIIQVMAKGSPPMGDSFAVFYFTGIIPYHLFTHIGNSLMSAIRANRSLLQLPPVTTLDVFIARALLELATEFAACLVLMSVFLVIGLKAAPVDPIWFILTFLMLGACAFGVGIYNAILSSYFPSWEKVWSVSLAVMYFTSGTFYIPAMMPVQLREVLAWSPILQGIEIFRSSMFQGYDPPWIDLSYMGLLTALLVGSAVIAERLCRNKLLEME